MNKTFILVNLGDDIKRTVALSTRKELEILNKQAEKVNKTASIYNKTIDGYLDTSKNISDTKMWKDFVTMLKEYDSYLRLRVKMSKVLPMSQEEDYKIKEITEKLETIVGGEDY